MKEYAALLLLFASAIFAQPLTTTPESAALCPCSTQPIEISLSNPANTDRTYYLSSLGSAAQWTTLTERTITLKAGESAKTFAYLTAPCNAQEGSQTLEIKANYGEQSESQKIGVDVLGCYKLNAEPSEQNLTGCRGDLLSSNLSISNSGKYKEIVLIDTGTPATWANPFVLTLQAQEKKSIEILFNTSANDSDRYLMNLAARSSRSPAATSAHLNYQLITCYNLSLSAPASIDACRGEEEDLQVEAVNNGVYNESATLLILNESSVLHNRTILLEPNLRNLETFGLKVPANERETISIILQTAHSTEEKKTKLNILDCNAFSAVLDHGFERLCQCQSGNSTLTITNLGKREQNVSITTTGIANLTGKVAIAPYGKKELTILITVPCETTPPQKLEATVSNQGYTQKIEGELPIPEFGACYNTSAEIRPQNIQLPRGKGELLNVSISNPGFVQDTFEIAPFGGDWIFANPNKITLEPGENKTIYLYANPPATLKPDNYTVGVVLKSKRQLTGGYAKITVSSDVYAPQAAEAPPLNGTSMPANLTSILQAAGNLTNASATPTGYAALGRKGVARTLAIIGILITILLILLVSWKARKEEEPTEPSATTPAELTAKNSRSMEDTQKTPKTPETTPESGADAQKTFFSHFTILARKVTKKEPAVDETEEKKQDTGQA